MYKVAIIGFGSSGQRFLALVHALSPQIEVVVCTARSLQTKGARVVSSLRQVVDFEPDLVVISGSAAARAETIEGLPLGLKGIFVEKPLARSMAEGTLAAEALRARAGVVEIGYNLRFSPSLIDFRKRIHHQVYGATHGVRVETGQYLPTWRPERDYRTTVSSRADSGGGVLLELSHEFDYLNWMFGRPLWVSANVGKVSNLEIDVEDQAMLHMGFRPNHSASNVSASLNLDFVRRDATRTCTLIGDRGSLKWDCITGVVQRFDIEQNKWLETFSQSESGAISYLNEWSHLIDCIHGKDRPLISGQDGKNVLSIIEACWKSASNSQRQDVNYGD